MPDYFHIRHRPSSGRALFGQAASRLAATGIAVALAFAPVGYALADHEDTAGSMPQDEPSDSSENELYGDEKIEVDILADQLKSAQATSMMAQVRASATKVHSDILTARIPEQQARSDEAARNLYKMQQNSYDIVEMLLSSQSIEAFILQVDYLHDVTQSNVHQIKRASKLKKQAKRTLSELKEVSSSAKEQEKEIKTELEAAQDERIDRAAVGVATAESQAVTLGGESSVEVVSDSKGDKDKKSDKDKDSGKSEKKTKVRHTIAATTDTSAIDSGADWSQSKEEFVAEWAPRLDAYLQGSPLYGQGENFAKSAWKYCIDPRWSAAISCTESSRGSICIRPHNAWGWGAAEPKQPNGVRGQRRSTHTPAACPKAMDTPSPSAAQRSTARSTGSSGTTPPSARWAAFSWRPPLELPFWFLCVLQSTFACPHFFTSILNWQTNH